MLCIHLFGTGLGAASGGTRCSGISFGLDLLCMSRFSSSVVPFRCVPAALPALNQLFDTHFACVSSCWHKPPILASAKPDWDGFFFSDWLTTKCCYVSFLVFFPCYVEATDPLFPARVIIPYFHQWEWDSTHWKSKCPPRASSEMLLVGLKRNCRTCLTWNTISGGNLKLIPSTKLGSLIPISGSLSSRQPSLINNHPLLHSDLIKENGVFHTPRLDEKRRVSSHLNDAVATFMNTTFYFTLFFAEM